MKPKIWIFEKINKINNLLDRVRKILKTQITSIRDERRKITIDSMDIKWMIREDHKKFYLHIFDNLHEVEQFLKKYKLPKLIKK